MPRATLFPFPRQPFGDFNRTPSSGDLQQTPAIPSTLLPAFLSQSVAGNVQGPGTSLTPLVPGSPAVQGPVFQGNIAGVVNPLVQQIIESGAALGLSASEAQNALIGSLLNSLLGGF